VEVEARLHRFGRDHIVLESAPSRLSSVNSVAWSAVEQAAVVLTAEARAGRPCAWSLTR
jgi:hypothetical protein